MAKQKSPPKARPPIALSKQAAAEQLAQLGLHLTPSQQEQLGPDLEALARNIGRLNELNLHDVALPLTLRHNRTLWQTWRYTNSR